MAESVDAMDSKPIIFGCEGSSPSRGTVYRNPVVILNTVNQRSNEAFIIGVALGDGNLSNPNGRAVRLRITCDTKYPGIVTEIATGLQDLFPNNQVSQIDRKDNCVDISVYSNKLQTLLPWQANKGSKYDQQAHVPTWIFDNQVYVAACLRGLILSDGSIYKDRGYTMINFCSNIKPLADDVLQLAANLGFSGTMTTTAQPSGKVKYTVRFAKNTKALLDTLNLQSKS